MDTLRSICYIVAMEAEATPLIEEFGLRERVGAFAPLPSRLFEGEVSARQGEVIAGQGQGEGEGLRLYVVTNGRQHDRDLVGCEAASLTTAMAATLLHPQLFVSSGTCGAFARRGAEIGRVYIGHSAMFHDRRIPGDDAWHTQSLGDYPAWEGSLRLAERLGLPTGKVTTGSSLDMQPCDLSVIEEHGGELKDMEGAAVGFVASLYHTPVLYVKAVTDLLDSPASTYEQFTLNLHTATSALRKVNRRLIATLSDASYWS